MCSQIIEIIIKNHGMYSEKMENYHKKHGKCSENHGKAPKNDGPELPTEWAPKLGEFPICWEMERNTCSKKKFVGKEKACERSLKT